MNLMPSQVFPISFISFSTVRLHVILGRPRLRFPSGVQCMADFAMEASWRVTWPIHLQRFMMTFAKILLGVDNSVMPRQLLLSDRAPFFGILMMTPLFQSSGIFLLSHMVLKKKFHQKPYNKSFIDQVCSVKMAEYWPRSFFANLLTSTSSRSINTQKKNLANIQPS